MIEGLDAVTRKLNRLTPTMKREIKRANRDALAGVVTVARARAPKVSGRLAGTLRAFGTVRGGGVQVGGTRAVYAPPVHWGTGPRPGRRGPHNITPNPFLFEALDDRRRDVLDKYEAMVARSIAAVDL